jgi:hypothetical protein
MTAAVGVFAVWLFFHVPLWTFVIVVLLWLILNRLYWPTGAMRAAASPPYRHQPTSRHLEGGSALLDRGGLVRRLYCAKPDGFRGDLVDGPGRRRRFGLLRHTASIGRELCRLAKGTGHCQAFSFGCFCFDDGALSIEFGQPSQMRCARADQVDRKVQRWLSNLVRHAMLVSIDMSGIYPFFEAR